MNHATKLRIESRKTQIKTNVLKSAEPIGQRNAQAAARTLTLISPSPLPFACKVSPGRIGPTP